MPSYDTNAFISAGQWTLIATGCLACAWGFATAVAALVYHIEAALVRFPSPFDPSPDD